jgi:hypothetical protein
MMKRISAATLLLTIMTVSSVAYADSCKLHYILESGSNGVQSGYSSYAACMKAGNGSASFSNKIKSFYCECKK